MHNGPQALSERQSTGSPAAHPLPTRRLYAAAVALASLTLLVSAALLLLYVSYFYRSHFSSDDAVVNTLAGAMWEQGSLLPRGWVNFNGDLMVPSGAIIVAPLLRWFSNGFAVHAVVGIFATISMLALTTLLMRQLRVSILAALIALTILASGMSFGMTVFVFTQTTYFWWPAGLFLGASIIARFYRSNPSGFQRATAVGILFVVIFCISFANPVRVGTMMVLPLYVFDIALRRPRFPSEIDSRTAKYRYWLGLGDSLTVYGILVPFLAAAAIYFAFQFTGITTPVYGAAALRWGGWGSVLRHLSTFGGWFDYMGASESLWSLGTWFDMFGRAFRWGVAIWLLWIAVIEVLTLRRRDFGVRRALGYSLIAAFLPVFAVYTVFEPLAVSSGGIRYFTVPILLLVPLGACRLTDLFRSFPTAAPITVAAFAMSALPASAHLFVPGKHFGAANFWEIAPSRQMRLAELLRRENLSWGYATWWNAGATTVMSDSHVQVIPVGLGPGGAAAHPFMVLNDWYDPSRWAGETFLALTPDEDTADMQKTMSRQFGLPTRILNVESYKISVYDHNIAVDFSCLAAKSFDHPISDGRPPLKIVSARLHVPEGSENTSLEVLIRNEGATPVGGSGKYPFSVGVQLVSDVGDLVNGDWVHVPIGCPLRAGEERSMYIPLPPASHGRWIARVDLVQEGVAWFQNRGVAPTDIPFLAQ